MQLVGAIKEVFDNITMHRMEYLEILPPCLLFTSRQNIKMNQNTKYSSMWTLFQYLIYRPSLLPVWYNAASTEQIFWTCCCRIHQTICQNIFLVSSLNFITSEINSSDVCFLRTANNKKSHTVPNPGSTQGVLKFQFWCMLLLLKWVIQLHSWISSSNFCLLKLRVAATGLQDCSKSFTSKFLALSVAYRGGGVWVVQTPLKFQSPPKSCQTQPDWENW